MSAELPLAPSGAAVSCPLSLSAAVLPAAPVRRGDVFAYAGKAYRAATVIETLPGGQAIVRIETRGTDNQVGVRVATITTRELRSMPRLGRAAYRDGIYVSARDLASAGPGCAGAT